MSGTVVRFQEDDYVLVSIGGQECSFRRNRLTLVRKAAADTREEADAINELANLSPLRGELLAEEEAAEDGHAEARRIVNEVGGVLQARVEDGVDLVGERGREGVAHVVRGGEEAVHEPRVVRVRRLDDDKGGDEELRRLRQLHHEGLAQVKVLIAEI